MAAVHDGESDTHARSSGPAPVVAEVVGLLLEAFRAADSVAKGKASDEQCLVKSYLRDFKFLWDFDGALAEWLRGSSAESPPEVFLVWDGIVSEGGAVPLEHYLTPLDWAVAVTLRCADSNIPPPTIHILDLASAEAAGAQALKWFDLIGPRLLPHVHRYTALEDSFPSAMRSPRTSAESAVSADQASALRQLWSGHLTRTSRPDDHHAIANVVGPLLLLGDSYAATRSSKALWQLVKSLQIAPGGSGLLAKEPWVRWSENECAAELVRFRAAGCTELNLVVVDDFVFTEGWGDVLCCALGLDPEDRSSADRRGVRIGTHQVDLGERRELTINLYAWESPEEFLQDVGIVITKTDENTEGASDEPRSGRKDSRRIDKRFRLEVIRSGQPAPMPIDALFLDLRLYAAGRVGDEAQFVSRLLPIARSFSDSADRSQDEEAPWPEFLTEKLSLIEKWCDDARRTGVGSLRRGDAYTQALTLLPRVLAQIDLALPIILFSSTGRRDITKLLQEHGTIITDFEKPRLVAMAEDGGYERVATGFRSAVSTALSLARARATCRAIHRAIPRNDRRVPAASGNWAIHLMLDESGGSAATFTVGGMLVITPPGVALAEIDDAVLVKYPGIKAAGGKDYCKENREQIAAEIRRVAAEKSVFVAAVSLTGRLNDPLFSSLNELDELRDERVGDNLDRELIRSTIALSLYCLAPRMIPQGAAVDFNLRAATRQPRLPDDPVEAATLRQALYERWGIEVVDVGTSASPDLRIRYFGFDAARPIVEQVMDLYRGSSFRPAPGISRAYPVNSHGRAAANFIPALHFFADAVLSPSATGDIEWLWDNGFKGTFDRSLQILLRTHRSIQNSFVAGGLAGGAGTALKALRGQVARNDAIHQLLREMRSACEDITGEEFVQFSHLLEDSPPEETSERILGGRVVARTRSHLSILDERGRVFLASPKQWRTISGSVKVGDRVRFHAYPDTVPNRYRARQVELLRLGPGEPRGAVVVDPYTVQGSHRAASTAPPAEVRELLVRELAGTVDEPTLRKAFEDRGYTVRSVKVCRDFETGKSRGFGFVELANAMQAAAAVKERLALHGASLDLLLARPRTARPRRSDVDGSKRPMSGGGSDVVEDRSGVIARVSELDEAREPRVDSHNVTLGAGKKDDGNDVEERDQLSEMRQAVASSAPEIPDDTIYVGNVPYDVEEGQLRALFEKDGRKIVELTLPADPLGGQRGFAFVKFATREDASAAVAQLDGVELLGRILRIREYRASQGVLAQSTAVIGSDVGRRVHELAKELGLETKDIIARLDRIGVPNKGAQSSLSSKEVERLLVELGSDSSKSVIVGAERLSRTEAGQVVERRVDPHVIRRRPLGSDGDK